MRKSFKAVLSMMFCMLLVSSTMLVALAALGNVTVLKATNVTHNSATLTWKAASGADGYQYRSYTGGTYSSTVTISGKNNTTYKAKLTPGKTYYLYVRSYDKGLLKTTYGSWVKVTVKAVPAAVTNFKAAKLAGGTSLKFTWTKVSGATGYLVQRYSDSKKAYVNCGTTTGSSLTVKSLYAGTEYKFRIAAYYKYNGKNIYGSYTNITATPNYLAPASLKVTKTTANSVTISWSAVSGAKNYQIYNYNTKKYTTTTKTSITLTGLEAGTAYKVRVRGYAKVKSKNVYGAYTSYLSFTTVTDKVTNLQVTDLSQTGVDISFDKMTNALGYQVFLYDYATKKETKLIKQLTANTYSIDGLTPGSTYRIGVRTYIRNNTYYYSAKSYVYIDTPPVVEAGANTNETDIELEWTKVRKATRYTVERMDPYRYVWNLSEEIPVEVPYNSTVKSQDKVSYIDKNAGKNKGYIYRVKAYNGNTLINETEAELTTTGIALEKGAFSATVNWEAQANAVRYDVRKYNNPLLNGTYTSVPEFSINDADAESFTINLAPNEYMTYSVYGYSKNNIGLGEVATFTVKSAPLVIDSSDASKTAQLLMLVNAINKAKLYRGDCTAEIAVTSDIGLTQIDVSNSPEMILAMSLIYPKLALLGGVLEGEDLDEFVEKMEMEDALGESGTEKQNLTFANGIETTSRESISKYIEPCGNGYSLAYLYDANDAAAWKAGFSSVKTTYYPETGKYKVVATLKQEKVNQDTSKTETPYHSGFFSLGKILVSLSGEGVDVDYATLGPTTITAYIDKEGRIYNYKMVAPMTVKLSMEMEGMGEMAIAADFDTVTSYKLYF